MAAGAELHLPEYRERARDRMGTGIGQWEEEEIVGGNLCSKKGVIFIGNSFVYVCMSVAGGNLMCVSAFVWIIQNYNA